MAPLLLIRSALDDEKLGIEEKIALLTHGIADLTDVVALQITIEGGEPAARRARRTASPTNSGRRASIR